MRKKQPTSTSSRRGGTGTGPCYLFNLPQEVRDKIYFHSLPDITIYIGEHPQRDIRKLQCWTTPEGRKGFGNSQEYVWHRKTIKTIISLLLVSRSVSEQAARVVYASNKFVFTSLIALSDFVAIIPERHLRAMKEVKVDLEDTPSPSSELRLSRIIAASALRPIMHHMPSILYLEVELKFNGPQSSHTTTPPPPVERVEMVKRSKALRYLRSATVKVSRPGPGNPPFVSNNRIFIEVQDYLVRQMLRRWVDAVTGDSGTES